MPEPTTADFAEEVSRLKALIADLRRHGWTPEGDPLDVTPCGQSDCRVCDPAIVVDRSHHA